MSVFARYVVLACLHAFLRNLPIVWSVFLLVRTCVPTRSSEIICRENAGPLAVLMSTGFLLTGFSLARFLSNPSDDPSVVEVEIHT